MNKTFLITEVDNILVRKAFDYLNDNYIQYQHHVACLLKSSSGVEYKALHLDCDGFDVCAEPIALSIALYNGERNFDVLVSVTKYENHNIILNPCGNCRQLLLQYYPNIHIIINDNNVVKKVKINSLIPYPYQNKKRFC